MQYICDFQSKFIVDVRHLFSYATGFQAYVKNLYVLIKYDILTWAWDDY